MAAAYGASGPTGWTETFAADPSLAGQQLEFAARAAALAGCGRGKDAATLTAADRARWRGQARDWIRAELAAAGATPKQDAAGRQRSLDSLKSPASSPELAGVRDASGSDLLAVRGVNSRQLTLSNKPTFVIQQ